MTKEEIRARWVKALRSGEYKQTTAQLKNVKGFCCLGVLCDLVQAETSSQWDGNYFGTANTPREHLCSLPWQVMKLAGIRDGDCTFLSQPGGLAAMNDSGSSFDEIADFIEKHPEEIFFTDGAQS